MERRFVWSEIRNQGRERGPLVFISKIRAQASK